MDTRDIITEELLAGVLPAQLVRKGYPNKSVYRIYNELVQSSQLSEHGATVVETETGVEEPVVTPPFTPTPPITTTKEKVLERTGAETIELGSTSLPAEAVNRIRGVLGISFRPKVLSCPTPELLYPAMVIAVTEFGFPPMRPDDFIDTVLYQWLEACDIVPYAFMRKSELEEMARKYNSITGGVATKLQETVVKSEGDGEVIEEAEIEPCDEEEVVEEMKAEPISEIVVEDTVSKEVENETHKPTVGDLLSRLHISNISKEIENGSKRCDEPSGSQGGDESGE